MWAAVRQTPVLFLGSVCCTVLCAFPPYYLLLFPDDSWIIRFSCQLQSRLLSLEQSLCPYCWVIRQVLTGKLTNVLSPSHLNWEKSQTVEMDQVEKGWLTSMRSLVLIPGFPHSHTRRGAACKCVIQGWEAGDRRIMGIPGNQLQIEWDIYLPHLKWWITKKSWRVLQTLSTTILFKFILTIVCFVS